MKESRNGTKIKLHITKLILRYLYRLLNTDRIDNYRVRRRKVEMVLKLTCTNITKLILSLKKTQAEWNQTWQESHSIQSIFPLLFAVSSSLKYEPQTRISTSPNSLMQLSISSWFGFDKTFCCLSVFFCRFESQLSFAV